MIKWDNKELVGSFRMDPIGTPLKIIIDSARQELYLPDVEGRPPRVVNLIQSGEKRYEFLYTEEYLLYNFWRK